MTGEATARARDGRLSRELYETDHTIHYVAAFLGRSYGWTRDLLLEAGTQLRSQGARRRQNV
ncbi:helix-turn-helix domain-containing protein [Streptomyces sp. ME08-AFT2]|uniref:helix-turn-helix domain-containing protein n=1 Tax=Streptomyces sp. ME08-AFT2 TaxID=3028683 RepID=UPI0029A70AFF|nr:helix-turn-helix domain-containing protein [Streptomyces sp. ME08-AFT2]MDX3314698.1 helix-turn-helix domain-containing protein [Streptomyces sp. ME08-AFT2]